jgi:hypothetical protein
MDIVSAGVALPTAASAGRDVVGAFAGAGGCAGGFRPELTCLMRERDAAVPMCKVCRRALDQFFSALGDDGGHIGIPGFNKDCPARFRGDGYICDVCFDYPGICLTCPGKDPDCELCGDGAGELCSCDLDGFCDPKAGETCASCPNDCGICDAAPCDFDGTCDAGEACGTCTDCGSCGGDGSCGDGACDGDEDPTSCPGDCGCASLDFCGFDPDHPDTPAATMGGCYCDEACETQPGKPRSCCPDACSSCGVGC